MPERPVISQSEDIQEAEDSVITLLHFNPPVNHIKSLRCGNNGIVSLTLTNGRSFHIHARDAARYGLDLDALLSAERGG